MPRSRPASNPLSFHRHTGQFYVTRGGRRIYLGANRDEAMERYHRLALNQPAPALSDPIAPLSAKELANRFIAAQRANWRSRTTLQSYRDWLGRFLADHPGFRASQLAVETFAAWKLSLRERSYSRVSINHFLKAVRAMYVFAEESGLINESPRLRRVRNEPSSVGGAEQKPLYGLYSLGFLGIVQGETSAHVPKLV